MLASLSKDEQVACRGVVGSTVTGFAFHSLESYLSTEEVELIHKEADLGDKSNWSEGMKETHELQMAKWLDHKAPAME